MQIFDQQRRLRRLLAPLVVAPVCLPVVILVFPPVNIPVFSLVVSQVEAAKRSPKRQNRASLRLKMVARGEIKNSICCFVRKKLRLYRLWMGVNDDAFGACYLVQFNGWHLATLWYLLLL